MSAPRAISFRPLYVHMFPGMSTLRPRSTSCMIPATQEWAGVGSDHSVPHLDGGWSSPGPHHLDSPPKRQVPFCGLVRPWAAHCADRCLAVGPRVALGHVPSGWPAGEQLEAAPRPVQPPHLIAHLECVVRGHPPFVPSACTSPNRTRRQR